MKNEKENNKLYNDIKVKVKVKCINKETDIYKIFSYSYIIYIYNVYTFTMFLLVLMDVQRWKLN